MFVEPNLADFDRLLDARKQRDKAKDAVEDQEQVATLNLRGSSITDRVARCGDPAFVKARRQLFNQRTSLMQKISTAIQSIDATQKEIRKRRVEQQRAGKAKPISQRQSLQRDDDERVADRNLGVVQGRANESTAALYTIHRKIAAAEREIAALNLTLVGVELGKDTFAVALPPPVGHQVATFNRSYSFGFEFARIRVLVGIEIVASPSRGVGCQQRATRANLLGKDSHVFNEERTDTLSPRPGDTRWLGRSGTVGRGHSGRQEARTLLTAASPAKDLPI